MALTSSEIDTSKTGGHRDRLEKIGMALEALRNVIKNSPGNSCLDRLCMSSDELSATRSKFESLLIIKDFPLCLVH